MKKERLRNFSSEMCCIYKIKLFKLLMNFMTKKQKIDKFQIYYNHRQPTVTTKVIISQNLKLSSNTRVACRYDPGFFKWNLKKHLTWLS